MSNFSDNSNSSHLEYYLKHGLSPVHYRSVSRTSHSESRESMYQSLGLTPALFKGIDVLEVAPGSGQNSVYAASCMPSSLTLVEPNPTGREQITRLYEDLDFPHVKPVIEPKKLQEFDPGRNYDVVICENWLGARADEVELLKKLASLVSPGGILVVTAVPIAGFFPNIMRRLLALRIAPESMEFEERTQFLIEAFGPHLQTIEHMTRSHRDWIHDCMMNPHYLNVALPFETIVAAIGDKMEMMSSFPRFSNDWRWFKSLSRKSRKYNERLVDAQAGNLCNFLDYRKDVPPSKTESDEQALKALNAVHSCALDWENALLRSDDKAVEDMQATITGLLDEIAGHISPLDPDISDSIRELSTVWQSDNVHADDISRMQNFNHIFGRETVYLSMVRTG